MTKDDYMFRRAQRFVRDNARSAGNKLDESAVIKNIVKKGEDAQLHAQELYQKSGIERAVKPATRVAEKSHSYLMDKASEVDESFEISQRTKSAIHTVNRNLGEPTKRYLNEVGVTDVAVSIGRVTGDSYGAARGLIKPYFAPDSARELLENTQRELTNITASILQISHGEAEGWLGQFGKLVSAKFAGVAGTATLFTLVGTFGTAGTGTAIAGLSGAAANSATLSAIGGVFGGGMAAGALVLSGFGILLGIGAYKLMSSTARDFDTLPEEDKRIVSTAGILSAAIQEELDRVEINLPADEAIQFLEHSLVPFQQNLEANAEMICSRLDNKNAFAFRQHVVRDFKPVVVQGFRKYAETAPASINGMIAGVFYALLTNSALDGSSEQSMVLEALRRSKNNLEDATEAEISDYLQSKSPEELHGVANNVKGIYHELRHAEKYNAEHQDSYAVLHESTTHQGSDVKIISKETGETLDEYQLKATDDISYVKKHQSQYSNIEVKATDEVAAKMESVESSGLSNHEMTYQTDRILEEMADNTIADRVIESTEITGLATAGLEALNVLSGKTNPSEAGKKVVGTVVSAAAATGITAFLFS